MIEAREADDITWGNDVRWGEKKVKGGTHEIPKFKELAEKELSGNEMEKFRDVGRQRLEYCKN